MAYNLPGLQQKKSLFFYCLCASYNLKYIGVLTRKISRGNNRGDQANTGALVYKSCLFVGAE